MKYTDLNRSGGIGCNSSLIQLGSFKFLIDAGLHPKEIGMDAVPDYDHIKDVDLDFTILTHCHLDHLGSLPIVARRDREMPIFTSYPSSMLAGRMLRNSVNVMKRQRKEKGIVEYPLFTFHDVALMEEQYQPIRFEQPEVIRKGKEKLTITLYPSGHVAGAASVLIEHEEKTIYVTGDILFDELMTLPGARIPDMKVDVVLSETTRGLTVRKPDCDRQSEWDRLFDGIRETLERGGSVLLPVFALGRLQEVLAMLNKARKDGKIPRSRVYGAGLGMDIVEYFDQITRETGLLRFRKKVLKELKLESPRIPQNPGFDQLPQGIYVLSSGMMVEKTPSYSVASCLLNSDLNSIFFVGYCDPDTPGGKLKMTEKGENFSFDAFDVDMAANANVESFDLSGHADREELLDLIAEFEPEHVILTHGDPAAREWFSEQIKAEKLVKKITDPQPLEEYTI